jgi:hypothetical protein
MVFLISFFKKSLFYSLEYNIFFIAEHSKGGAIRRNLASTLRFLRGSSGIFSPSAPSPVNIIPSQIKSSQTTVSVQETNTVSIVAPSNESQTESTKTHKDPSHSTKIRMIQTSSNITEKYPPQNKKRRTNSEYLADLNDFVGNQSITEKKQKKKEKKDQNPKSQPKSQVSLFDYTRPPLLRSPMV